MAVSKPIERRREAIGNLVNTFLNEGNGYTVENTAENREAYAKLCRDMVKLGRTIRWTGTCEGAARTALDNQTDLGWCVRQYAVYLGYAAE